MGLVFMSYVVLIIVGVVAALMPILAIVIVARSIVRVMESGRSQLVAVAIIAALIVGYGQLVYSYLFSTHHTTFVREEGISPYLLEYKVIETNKGDFRLDRDTPSPRAGVTYRGSYRRGFSWLAMPPKLVSFEERHP